MSMFNLPSEDFPVVAPSKEVSLVTGEGCMSMFYLPPEEFPMAAPSEEATLVTAEGLYVHEVPHTSTFRSLSW